MNLLEGQKYFSESKKLLYMKLRQSNAKQVRAYKSCLDKNRIKITSLADEELLIKEGIRDDTADIEFLDCAIECCRFQACNHIFVFTDNPNHQKNLPCLCVKCGLSLNSALFPNFRKGTARDDYVPCYYYLAKLGINRENVYEYINHFNCLGYLPVSKDYVVRRYLRAKKGNPNATDEEIARIIIKTVTGEKQLTR